MMNLFKVLPEERRVVALLLLHYVWVVAVTIAGKSVRDAYFLNRFDRSYLPLMAVAAAIAVALCVAVFTRLERHMRSTILVPLTSLVFAATLASLHFRLAGWTIAALYIWMEVINVLTILQFWLLAAELLDPRQAKRLFPLIGGGGSLAAILIGPQLKPFSKAYGSDTLLWLVCLLLVGSAAVAIVTTRLPKMPAIAMPVASERRSGKKLTSPYLRMISVIVICAAVVSAIVDYQFKIISSNTLKTETDLVGFFGQFYAATGLSTLVLQFFLASRAFQRFGVVLVMAVLPFTLGLGSFAILFWPVLSSAVSARFSDQTFRFTLHNGGLELLWLPVPPAIRSEAKPFVTGSLKSISEGAVGVMMFVLLRFLTTAQFSIIALGFCGAWAVALYKLRSLYVSELQSAIANRHLPPEDLEVSATDALTVRVIDSSLSEGDTVQKLFVLGLIADIPLTPWRKTLQRLLDEGEPEVKARVLQIAAEDKTIVTNEELGRLAAKEGLEAIEAIRLIGTRKAKDLRQTVVGRLHDVQPSIRAAAYGTLTRLNGSGIPDVREALEKMLHAPTAEERIAALEETSRLDGVLTPAMLGDALTDSSRAVRITALQTAAAHPRDQHTSLIAAALSDSALFAPARDALAALPAAVVLPVLTKQLDEGEPEDVRRAAVRAMKICPVPGAYPVLLREVDVHWPVLANQASESLLAIARKIPPPADSEEAARRRRSEVLQAVCTLNEVLQALPESDDVLLLRDYITASIKNLLATFVRLASIARPESPIEMCIQTFHNRDRARMPFVLELMDTLLTPDERSRISPLLESARGRTPPSTPDGSGAKSSVFSDWLTESLKSPDEWLRAIALDYVLSGNSPLPADQVANHEDSASPLIREIVQWRQRFKTAVAHSAGQIKTAVAGQEKSHMLSTLEKTILLKSVPLFKDIPGAELSRVAQIAEEQTLPTKTVICRDGDNADCLYVIVNGSVRIEKRGLELAILRRAHSLGEMAVIDSAPRSADAIAIEETVVLRVGQEQFLEIMQSNSLIMQGVVRMLLARLRQVDERLADRAEAAAQGRSD